MQVPTLVTAIFALGRERLNPPFRRDEDHDRRHLSAVLARAASRTLDNFRASGARFLLATIPTGPVDLPPAVTVLPDIAGTKLGLWRLDAA
jgi:hypothetical protein